MTIDTGVVSAEAGVFMSLYLKEDRTLWESGYNNWNALKEGAGTIITSPILLATDVVAMSSGTSTNLFVNSNGVLMGMGENWTGKIGEVPSDGPAGLVDAGVVDVETRLITPCI